jgi:hypothetical protein
MSALFLLFVAVPWVALTAVMAYAVTWRIEDRALQLVVALVLVGVLLPLPLIDELMGKPQFEQLCKDNSTIQIDRATAVGKTVYLAKTVDVEIKGKWVRIVLKPWRFVDATTAETVVSYNTLLAEGGWLIRHLGISEGGVPMTFRGSCAPENSPGSIQTFAPLGIKYIEPPIAHIGVTK